jgi:hypothetical protein
MKPGDRESARNNSSEHSAFSVVEEMVNARQNECKQKAISNEILIYLHSRLPGGVRVGRRAAGVGNSAFR